jgi:hypothetical protein
MTSFDADYGAPAASPELVFERSSYCTYGNCVEVGRSADGQFAVRDSKDPSPGRVLMFTGEEWATFILGVKAGEFDH